MNLNNKIELSKDIFLYENFLTKEESSSLIKVLDKQSQTNKLSWMPISFYESYSSGLPKDNDEDLKEFGLHPTIISDIKQAIKTCVASIHNLKIDSIYEIGYHTQKWEPGAFAPLHSDNTDHNGKSGAFARSKYAAFIYLNNNFEGGLLRFPKQNIEISPKVGSMAVFDGGFNNMHEVTMITKGVRYTIGSFWDNKDESEYSEKIKKDWSEEMQKIRAMQKIEKEEWQRLLKEGYKIDIFGNKYKIEEIITNE